MQTLQDLIDRFHLYAVCESCQRMERLDLQQLIEHEGADYPVQNIRLRLYCRQCQQRSESLRIVYVGENERAANFHYNR